jgi:hypothetical protein
MKPPRISGPLGSSSSNTFENYILQAQLKKVHSWGRIVNSYHRQKLG